MNPDHLYLHSKSGGKLPVLFINNNAKYTMIFSHGNAEDIYLVQQWLVQYFLKEVDVNAVVYEYTGFGEANGTIPVESSLYEDIETVYLYLTEMINIPPEQIILFGRSIGSGPSCFLAEKYKVAGLILHAPLMSAFRVICPNLRWTLPLDKFPNIDRIKNVDCPTYIVHGLRDEIVPISHGHALYEAAANKTFPPYFVELAGHNNIEKFDKDYMSRIRKFLRHIEAHQEQRIVERQQEDNTELAVIESFE